MVIFDKGGKRKKKKRANSYSTHTGQNSAGTAESQQRLSYYCAGKQSLIPVRYDTTEC